MADKNYQVAAALVEQARVLVGAEGLTGLLKEQGYIRTPATQARQPAVPRSDAAMIIRPRGSDFQYAWDAKLTSAAYQKDHDLPHVASTLDYFATMKHVAQARQGNGVLAQVRNALRGDFKNNWMMTSTRNVYNPEGQKDALIHNWRSPRESQLETNLVGPDGWLAELSDAATLTKAYFGTDDVRDVIAVIEAVSGKKPYVWRLNEKPSQTVERPVVLGLVDDWFGIGAVSVGYGWPARGVGVAQKISSGKKK